MNPPRPFVRICAWTVGSPSIVNGFAEAALDDGGALRALGRDRGARLPPPPIGSIAWAVAGLPPLEFIRSAPRWRMVTVFGCRRSQFSALKRPPPRAMPGQVWV